MMNKFTSTVAGGAIFITIIGVLGRGIGVVRESIFANYFGLSLNYDLYLIATVFPVTVNSIMYYVAQNYFIPKYHQVRKEKSEQSQKIRINAFIIFLTLGIVLSVLFYFFADEIICKYLVTNDQKQFILTKNLFLILLISIPFGSGIAILSSILQSEYEFKYPALSNLFLNAIIILFVVLLTESIGIYSISWGYVCGILVQFIYLAIKSSVKLIQDYKYFSPKFALGLLNSTLMIIIVIELFGQVYLIADRYFFFLVDQGGIAALNYAFSIYMLPIGILSLSISTAIFPKLSDSENKNDPKSISQNMNYFFDINLFLFIPITFLFFFEGNEIIKVLYQRGQFFPEDTEITFNVLKFYSLSLIFFSSYAGINKLIFSNNLVKQMLAISVIALFAKFLLNFFFVNYLKQEGLALSSSISFFILFMGSYLLVIRKKIIIGNYSFMNNLIFNLLNSLVSYHIITMLFSLILQNTVFITFLKIFLFVVLYFFNGWLFRQTAVNIFFEAFGNMPLIRVLKR